MAEALEHRRSEAINGAPSEVQPLIRIAGSASFPRFKADQAAAWARQGGTYSAATWPDAIAEGEFAAVLLPLSAGRVGPALGAQPRAMMTPHFSHGRPTDVGRYDDIALGLMATWISACPNGVRVAPPVVELMQRGRAVERHLFDLGLTWHLPAPDGI